MADKQGNGGPDNGGGREGLYNPGCITMVPALLLIGLIVLGVLGAISIWLFIPIAAALAAIAGYLWYLNRAGEKK